MVTGFLGPNGAGKSTTMRVIAGLDRPTSGTVRVNGKHYPEAAAPMSELGILLDARSVHPGLSARNNLLALARTAGIGRRRVDEVIELAGLGEVAGTRAGGFSLGMGQRLGVAAALLGQPQTVVLDEPVNGLDPDGVRWIRLLLKSLAAEGRTVFVSSHLMSEMAQTATRLVVLGRGRLISETSVEDFTDHAAGGVLVRTPETGRLGQVLAAPGVTVINDGTDLLRVSGTTAEQIGAAAWRAHLPVYELTPTHASLEEAFMQVTKTVSSTTPERHDERRRGHRARDRAGQACPCALAPAASCSGTPSPPAWSPPSVPSQPATPSWGRPPPAASSASSPSPSRPNYPAASTPLRYGRSSPTASKTSSPVSPPACPTARGPDRAFPGLTPFLFTMLPW